MFTLPDAIALLAVTLPVAAAVWRYVPRRNGGGGDASNGARMASFADELRSIEARVRAMEIGQNGFREECRGEFKVIKQMIQFLPSGQPRHGGIGFGEANYAGESES